MSKIIKNFKEIAPNKEITKGTFTSKFFKNENTQEMTVYTRNKSLMDYAEKCINHFNSLSDDMIDEICHGLIESCHLSDSDVDFELPELENVRDILDYCWFTSLVTIADDGIYYLVEGKGDWGEEVGFVIHNDNVNYVGYDYFNVV
ncbi:MAG: hypothetical protein K2K02_07105 [Ruminococcus sp.]|nr:hypothetical protein [Ruminococcus sp.]MDE6678792.1 hypothetical protein [Ruminococcus sp.]